MGEIPLGDLKTHDSIAKCGPNRRAAYVTGKRAIHFRAKRSEAALLRGNLAGLIGYVVGAAHESVECAEGVALLRRQQAKAIIKIACGHSRDVSAVIVGIRNRQLLANGTLRHDDPRFRLGLVMSYVATSHSAKRDFAATKRRLYHLARAKTCSARESRRRPGEFAWHGRSRGDGAACHSRLTQFRRGRRARLL